VQPRGRYFVEEQPTLCQEYATPEFSGFQPDSAENPPEAIMTLCAKFGTLANPASTGMGE